MSTLVMNRSGEFSNSYTSLRAAEEQVSSQYFEALTRRTLLLIGSMSKAESSLVNVAVLRSVLGINTRALEKILEHLANQKYVQFMLQEGVSIDSDFGLDQLLVELSPSGEIELAREQLGSFYSSNPSLKVSE